MRDEEKSRDELIEEIRALRERLDEAERADLAAQGHFLNILGNVPLMIAYVGSDHRFVFCSREYESRFNLEPGSLVGRRIEEVLPPRSLRRIAGRLKEAFAGEVSVVDVPFELPDGKMERTLRIICVPHAGPGGDRGVLAFGSDISELRELEDRHRMEQELLNAKKLEAIGILAGGIAHDFNNLLFVILGNISMAQMKMKPGPESRHLAEAQKACLRARDLTQKFITFSSGGGPIKDMVSIKNLVEDAASLILSGSNLSSDIRIPRDLWKADIDEDQMRQALTGIIANAKEAMPRGGTLRIEAANLLISSADQGLLSPIKAGRYIKLVVEDDGIGIHPENMEKIFDPYFSTKYRGSQKGMGFGLSITHSVIKRHSGHIKIDSEPGKGTRVTIMIPASTGNACSVEPGRLPIGHRRVLVMDDEEMLGDLAKTMLEHLGYEAGVAVSGEQAIQMYADSMEHGREWDVLILDLTVKGGMGAKDALRKLRYLNPDVKTIVSSGYANDPIMSEYAEEGFQGVLHKPYVIDQLKDVLTRILSAGNPEMPPARKREPSKREKTADRKKSAEQGRGGRKRKKPA